MNSKQPNKNTQNKMKNKTKTKRGQSSYDIIKVKVTLALFGDNTDVSNCLFCLPLYINRLSVYFLILSSTSGNRIVTE